MTRAICFDVTHLVSRLMIRAPSGIDKVDLAYGRHFAARALGPGVHYGLGAPHTLTPARVREITDLAQATPWEDDGAAAVPDAALARVEQWLKGDGAGAVLAPGRTPTERGHGLQRLLQKGWFRIVNDKVEIPRGAIYLNAAQHVFEQPMFFRWLEQRPDIKPAFLVHDLLPLDHAEYFRPGYRVRFGRRVATIARFAGALITTTAAVRERLQAELEQRGRSDVPIHVQPLPSTLHPADAQGDRDEALVRTSYFVILGTIEPRKNHMLLLNIWRQLAERGGPVPKLVIVGARGWENEQVADVLDRGLLTRPHVLEVSGLGTAALVRLLRHARALLMPSFAEGYGLPVVEALTLGTPVVASDISVFREVSQGCAVFRHVLDGVSWRETILSLSDAASPALHEARTRAAGFVAPTWPGYFRGVEDFLQGI